MTLLQVVYFSCIILFPELNNQIIRTKTGLILVAKLAARKTPLLIFKITNFISLASQKEVLILRTVHANDYVVYTV